MIGERLSGKVNYIEDDLKEKKSDFSLEERPAFENDMLMDGLKEFEPLLAKHAEFLGYLASQEAQTELDNDRAL